MRLGIALRLVRVTQGTSLRELAAEVGISASTLSRVENGIGCDVHTLLKLLGWLLGGSVAAGVRAHAGADEDLDD